MASISSYMADTSDGNFRVAFISAAYKSRPTEDRKVQGGFWTYEWCEIMWKRFPEVLDGGSRRDSRDSRRNYSRESRHEEVEDVPNIPRVGGLSDMYRMVMQLLQQQSITQQQQNTTQAALLQLINRGQPTLPSRSDDYQDAAQVQGGPQVRPSDIDFFDPDVADEKGQRVVAEGKSFTTIYKCVLARLSKTSGLLASKARPFFGTVVT
ncbi:hypothetical protein E4U26_006516 [Claviceps purpurea]|nr:hypothetical protein E4U26_006516 [Claviceps purpurea]